MEKSIFSERGKIIIPSDTIEVKIFQNKNNKQFNLPVLKRHTSPQIINDILSNKDVIGLKFKITDVIFRKNKGDKPYRMKGGRT